MAAWNALFIIAGLILIALAGEAYFRLTKPFIESNIPHQFVDGVGRILKIDSELRHANWRSDNFVVSRVNSWGFLDREPISPERAAAGCHIAFIGDSYVEALQTPIADKFHVRLEDMAARELPHLDITTQAYGIAGTGQINQLPFYDEYARRLNPKLLILIFYINDFLNNSTALQALHFGADPDRMPFMSAQKDEHGVVKLRPPDPEYERFLLPTPPPPPWYESAWKRLARVSYFAKWLDTKGLMRIVSDGSHPDLAAWADIITERPCCASLLDGWQPAISHYRLGLGIRFKEEHLPPVFEEALEYTDFGIEQFKRRADRDGVNLGIMAATPHMGTRGDPQFERLSAIAEARGIPIITQQDYIIRRGYDAQDGRWDDDPHWNATGHYWAAEAILEWLKTNQDVCD